MTRQKFKSPEKKTIQIRRHLEQIILQAKGITYKVEVFKVKQENFIKGQEIYLI